MAPRNDDGCRATKADGSACGAPPRVVDPDTGLCPAHGPDASQRMSAIGRKGAEASAQRFRRGGLDPDDLPPLETHEDAKRWLELLARGVATSDIDRDIAAETPRLVKGWMRAYDAETLDEWKDDIEDTIAALQRRLEANDQPWR